MLLREVVGGMVGMSDIALANGNLAPACAVYALHCLDGRWPGATLPQARAAIVDAILTALREDGYSIVELPKPDRCVEETRDENAHQQWDYPHGHITAFSDGEIHWGNWSSIRPEKVRKAAAALLAAANYAEEGTA